MNPFTLALIGLVIAALWVLYRRQPAAQKGPYLVKLALISLVSGLVFLAVTRRLYILGALLAGLLPFIRHLMPWLMRLLPLWMHWRIRKGRAGPSPKGSGGAGTGQRSEVKADILEMELDHDTGVMYGTVIEGPMSGRDLADLKDDEFIELLIYCREKDINSARLLETYLDKRFGEKWRQDDPGDRQAEADEAPLTEADALNLLGLPPEASREDIIKAHRKLMLKHHPDRGGDPKMAARLNAARSFLLGE